MRATGHRCWVTWLPVCALGVFLLFALLFAGCSAPLTTTTSPSQVSSTTVATTPPSTGGVDTSPTSTEIPVTSSTAIAGTSTISASVVGTLQVHYIDVGQGDSILILAPDGKVMLIDGGESQSGALAYLEAKGIKHIDLMVATHPHSDHIGGLVDILNALPVSEVVTNGASTTTLIYEHFLDGIKKAKAVYKEAKRGDTLTLGSLTFHVLSSEAQGAGDLNEGALVLRLVYGQVSFLFTGDAGKVAEAEMFAAHEDVSAQILKVGHHGSSSASSSEFLAAVHPEVAVYSCGLGNSYGHPAAVTIADLAKVGATVYGTDVNGTVLVTSDGSTYKVECEKGSPRGPPPAGSGGTTETTTSASSSTSTSPASLGPLSLKVVSLTSPISPGGLASLTIQTSPGADCTITVYYKSGPSKAKGLYPQTADDGGSVTWDWNVGSRTTPGAWKITVTATAGGKTKTIQTPFVVS